MVLLRLLLLLCCCFCFFAVFSVAFGGSAAAFAVGFTA